MKSLPITLLSALVLFMSCTYSRANQNNYSEREFNKFTNEFHNPTIAQSSPKDYQDLQSENKFKSSIEDIERLEKLLAKPRPNRISAYGVSTVPTQVNAPLEDWSESVWDNDAVNEEEFRNLRSYREERKDDNIAITLTIIALLLPFIIIIIMIINENNKKEWEELN